jgi:arabinose-5-phosphate isomerase
MTTDLPKVSMKTLFKDVIFEVSNKRLGMTLVYDENNVAVGIITDGDIRRAIQKFDDIKQLKASEFMTQGFKRIDKNDMLTEALEMMDVSNITTLAVMDGDRVCGILSIHHIIDFR